MGVPVPERIPGDCYVWGSSEAAAGGKSAISSPVPGWQHSNLPTLVENTTHLDVLQVSTGAHQDAPPAVVTDRSALPAVHGTSQCTPRIAARATTSPGCHRLPGWPPCDRLARNLVQLGPAGPLSIILCLMLPAGSACAQGLDAMAAIDAA